MGRLQRFLVAKIENLEIFRDDLRFQKESVRSGMQNFLVLPEQKGKG